MNKLDYIPWRRTSMFKYDLDHSKLYVASATGEGIFTINGIGSIIWQQIDGQKSILDLCKIVATTYQNVPFDRISADVMVLLDQMEQRSIITYNWDPLT